MQKCLDTFHQKYFEYFGKNIWETIYQKCFGSTGKNILDQFTKRFWINRQKYFRPIYKTILDRKKIFWTNFKKIFCLVNHLPMSCLTSSSTCALLNIPMNSFRSSRVTLGSICACVSWSACLPPWMAPVVASITKSHAFWPA